jgi:hypothetical protein
VVPFGDAAALTAALHAALGKAWDSGPIREYAQANTWDRRVDVLVGRFRHLHATAGADAARVRTASS